MIVVCEPTSGAIVLGSSQKDAVVDSGRCRAAGLEILQRRSGGGAVLVRPGAQVWIDVFLPRSDVRWQDDVLASFSFLGSAWCHALAETAPVSEGSLAVAAGVPTPATPWSKLICFAGLGAGEVTIDGRKVVGLSQRRDRSGAWFHSMAMLEFDPTELPGVLDLDARERAAAARALGEQAAAVPGGRPLAATLVSALVSCLSASP